MKQVCHVIIMLTMAASLPVTAFAANGTWNDTGVTSASWVNTDNWASAIVPGATTGTANTDIATFNTAIGGNSYGNSADPVIIDPGRNIGGLNFDTAAGNYFIGSTAQNPLLLSSGGTIQILGTLTATDAFETVNSPLVIEGASGTYTFSNNSANGNGAGAGWLIIGGTVTGSAAGNTVLNLSGSNMNANTISGIISNGSATSMAITKSGIGTWVLSGNNTYTGPTLVNAGTLEAGIANQAFGAGSAVTVAGAGTLDLGGFNETIGSLLGTGTVTSSAAGNPVLTVSADNNLTTFSGIIQNGIANSVGLAVQGTGSLTLSGANTYSGPTSVSNGTLVAGVANQAFGIASAVSIGTGAALDLAGFNEAIGSLTGGGTVTNSGGQDVTFTVGWDNTTNLTPFSGVITDGITNKIGLTKVGGGILFLSGNNTYTGPTLLNGGELNLDSTHAIGPGLVFFNGGSLMYSANNHLDDSSQFSNGAGQLFSIDTNGQNVSFATALTSSGGTLTKMGSGVLTLLANSNYSGTTTIIGGSLQIGNGGTTGSLGAGDVTDNANLLFDLNNNHNISNAISGTGTVSQTGIGIITLSGANTYSGATAVSSGTLQAGVADQAFGIGSAVTVGVGATLDLAGFDEAIGSLAGSGTVTSSAAGNLTLTSGVDNTSTNFSGIIQNGSASSVGLTKVGSGMLTLSGNDTYTGATNINAGILDLNNSSAIGPGTVYFNGGTLQYSANNHNDDSSQFSNGASQLFSFDTNGQDVSFATALTSSGGTLTKIGNGTLTLLANSNYSGITTISGGTLQIGNGGALGSLGAGDVTDNAGLTFDLSNSPNISNAISGTGSVTQSGTGTVTVSAANTYTGATIVSSGTLKAGSSEAFGVGSAVSVGAGGTLDLASFGVQEIGSLAGAGIVTNSGGGLAELEIIGNASTTFSGNILAGTGTFYLFKEGSGTLTLSGDNTYSGGTDLYAGTLNLGSSNAIGPGTIYFNGGILQYSASNNTDYSGQFDAGPGQSINIDTNGQTVTFADPITSAGGTLTKIGNGTLILASANNYTGATLISGGTLQVDNAHGLGTGPVTNNGTLAIGTTSLSLGGAYSQNSGSTLALSIYSTSNYGNIIAPSATLVAGSAIDVHITGYVQNNAQYEILNSGGTGIGSIPSTITSDNPLFSFTGSVLNGDLYLTADNILISLANNPNALTLANVLANETNPSSDLQAALSTLVHLSDAQISEALNTMGPIVNGGIIEDTNSTLNNFMGATLDRARNVLSRDEIINNSLNNAEGALDHSDQVNSPASGGESGDKSATNGIWAKPYGSYLGQATRQYTQGYNAWNAGTVVGVDRLVTDNVVLGLSGGYAYGMVDTDDNYGNTDITSAQSTIYTGYLDPNHNYYIDAAGSMAWNWYNGQRNISFINRTADSSYDGQQYSTYVESGYRFNTGVSSQSAQLFGNGVDIIPMVSLQWTHLSLGNYTETKAGALDLNVEKQNYDTLESGAGFSMGTSEINDWGIFTPEVHAKWLHDYIDDHMAVTSTFTGGGGSFTANGPAPRRDGLDFGSKLSFDFKKDISFIADCDIELRDGFIEVYGSGSVRYKF